MELLGKTAVVTGASRGIGRALAFALAREGCHLVLTALEPEELAATADGITAGCPVSVAWRAADLASPDDRALLMNWLAHRPTPPDILVNNAGAGRFGPFAASAPADVERTLQLCVHAPTLLALALLPALKRRPEAMIVNISSAVARLPYPGLAVYGASKGYLSSLSESLQCELAGTPVRLLCFLPGFTATGFMAAAGMDMRKIPRFMVTTPEAVAARIVRAMRRNATWVHGDASGRLGVAVASLLPQRWRVRLSRDFYWELPPS